MLELPIELNELFGLEQWVCHKGKIPKNPNAPAENAKANDPATWSNFYKAELALQQYNFDGVGFQFGIFEPNTLRISGIDLDHVIGIDGKLELFAQKIVNLMNSYTEYSPSGTGLHILCRTVLPDIGSRIGIGEESKYAIEMYNHRRYFTVTGHVYGIPKPIAERTKEFQEIHNYYFSDKKEKRVEQSILPQQQPIITVPELQPKQSSLTLSDDELLEKMFNSKNGSEMRNLWNGDISGYASHSEADLHLVTNLLFWTGGDELRTDNLFRQSGLLRSKWEDRADYRDDTIRKALSSLSSVYDPSYNNTSNQVNSVSSSPVSQVQLPVVLAKGRSISSYYQKDYMNDAQRFVNYKNRKTGFSNIDEITNLYPGLYVLGAISSLGKTTFACQLADQLVMAGEHVLYFSLEQSMYELVTKGFARTTARLGGVGNALTAIEIRNGISSELLKKAEAEYVRLTEHEIIYECGFDTTIETIIDCVKSYMNDNKVTPVVIVDYLQIIRPMDNRMSVKDVVDTHVRAFKKLQVENDLVVLLISSLNRSNYLTPVDFESFKESGGIEYTADIIWGLQLSVMNDEIFDKEKSLKSKRDKVREAKKATPREVELICLKNRYGVSSYTCKFKYYANCDYFVPMENDISSSSSFRPVLKG